VAKSHHLLSASHRRAATSIRISGSLLRVLAIQRLPIMANRPLHESLESLQYYWHIVILAEPASARGTLTTGAELSYTAPEIRRRFCQFLRVTIEQARSEVQQISIDLEREYPENRGVRAAVEPSRPIAPSIRGAEQHA
jgi:hypothetical protein